MKNEKIITVGITGASGVIYGLRLLEILIQQGVRIFLIVSKAARIVLEAEQGVKVPEKAEDASAFFTGRLAAADGQLRVFSSDDWFSPVASGSGAPRRMVICPCTAGTLASIAMGLSDNLLERAADVVLKERGQLILVLREMPLSAIHLENMLKLSRMGVTVMPASPGFYNNPKTVSDLVDSVVARILDHVQVEHTLTARWGMDRNV